MILAFRATTLTLVTHILWALLVYLAQGSAALVGVARLSGPLRSCLVVSTTANRSTEGSGNFNLSVGTHADQVIRVSIDPRSSCVDVFTNGKLPFQLSAALPPDATNGSVGYGSFMGLSYLQVLAVNSDTSASNTYKNQLLNNITAVRQVMRDLYGTFNISLAGFSLDPLQLQPMSLVRSTNTTIRSLGVALFAAEVEMGALMALGTALLNVSAIAAVTNSNANSTAAAAGAANMTLLAGAVAAEGARQLVQLEVQREALLAEAAAAAQQRNSTAIPSGNTEPAPPSPPSPPPVPSPSSVGGLYTTDVVVAVLVAAAARVNVTVPSYAVNATAAVVAGMAAYAEVVKNAALLEIGGVRLGLNPLNALISMTRLAVVQADAAAQIPALLGNNPQALQTYVLDALPERIGMASVNVTTIHTALGLSPPAAAVPTAGTAHIVGPLSGCIGQATGVWDPSYEAFITSGAGALTLSAKGQGLVTVTPYRYCQDGLTQLQLSLSLSNLGPAMAAVSVSPVAMLAQGFYTLQASQGLQAITVAQQTAAFTAMGLNLTAYNAFMILSPGNYSVAFSSATSWWSLSPPPPSPLAQVASPSPSSTESISVWHPPVPPSPPPTTLNTASGVGFNLSHPLMGAVIAANVQLVGLIYAARAMFATSCNYAYRIGSMENAYTFTVTLTLYGAAMQAVDSGGVLKLSDPLQLEEVFNFVATMCYFNSTAQQQFQNASSPDTATQQQEEQKQEELLQSQQQSTSDVPSGRGTFLSAGSATAIGAATTSTTTGTSSGRRRRLHSLSNRLILRLIRSNPAAAAAAAAARAMHWVSFPGSLGLSGHPNNAVLTPRRWEATLFALGVTGPEPLLWQRVAEEIEEETAKGGGGREGDWIWGWDAQTGQGWSGDCGGAAGGEGGGGDEGEGGGGEHPEEEKKQLMVGCPRGGDMAKEQESPRVAERGLAVYVDDPDIVTVYRKVAEILSGINLKLQAVQSQSNAAADAAAATASESTSSSPPSSSVSSPPSQSYNLTELVETASQLGFVVQQSLYTELANFMEDTYGTGRALVEALRGIAARYTGTALLDRMSEANINRELMCAAKGALCFTAPPPPPVNNDSSSSGKKSNTALYAGVGAGVGLGVGAVLLAVWAVRRAVRSRQVRKAVVNNFKAGDMHNMNLRLPSTVPLDGMQFGSVAGKPLESYYSLVPAALGSDPTVAQDYPLYPMPALSHNVASSMSASHASVAAPAAAAVANNAGGGGADIKARLPGQASVGAGGIPLNMSLPTPKLPPLTGAPDGGGGSGSSGALGLPQAQMQPQQQQQLSYNQPRLHSHLSAALPLSPQQSAPMNGVGGTSQRGAHTNGGVYKTYANYAYVGMPDGGSGVGSGSVGSLGGVGSLGADERRLGEPSSQRWKSQGLSQGRLVDGASGPSPLGPAVQYKSVDSGRFAETGPRAGEVAPRSPLQTSITVPQRMIPFSADGSGHGVLGEASSLLNPSTSRRPGLPPLAPYTSVTNPAAPTAALNASLRTIPVNTCFNSSLRPPSSSRA